MKVERVKNLEREVEFGEFAFEQFDICSSYYISLHGVPWLDNTAVENVLCGIGFDKWNG